MPLALPLPKRRPSRCRLNTAPLHPARLIGGVIFSWWICARPLDRLAEIMEVDETFLLESYRSLRPMEHPPRPGGGKVSRPGLPASKCHPGGDRPQWLHHGLSPGCGQHHQPEEGAGASGATDALLVCAANRCYPPVARALNIPTRAPMPQPERGSEARWLSRQSTQPP